MVEHQLPKLNTRVRFPSSALAKDLVRACFESSAALPGAQILVRSGCNAVLFRFMLDVLASVGVFQFRVWLR
jgi:hypothetical protein